MASDEEIKLQIVQEAYSACEGEEISCFLSRQDLINSVVEELGAPENEVEYNMKRLEDDGFFTRDGTTVEIRPPAVEFLRDNGISVLLDDSIQCEILRVLYEYERENPSYAHVDKEDIEAQVGEDEDTVNQNIWYLREQMCIELMQALGSLYVSAEITSIGRDVFERECR